MAFIPDLFAGFPRSADGQGLEIRELEIPFRTLKLEGGNRPKPVEVVDTVRLRRIRYPGRSEADIQAMGMDQEPITFNGRFSSPIDLLTGGPRRKAEILRAIAYTGNRVEVTWGDTIVRRGLIKQVKIKNFTQSRMHWSFTLEVASAHETGTEDPESVAYTPTQEQIGSFVQGVSRALNVAFDVLSVTQDVARLLPGGPESVPREFLDRNRR